MKTSLAEIDHTLSAFREYEDIKRIIHNPSFTASSDEFNSVLLRMEANMKFMRENV